jgi:hypothetical protein
VRCRKNYQGDRCRKGHGHDSIFLNTPDPWHVGQFSRWNGNVVEPLTPPSRVHRRDLRAMDQVLRNPTKSGLQSIIDWVRGR